MYYKNWADWLISDEAADGPLHFVLTLAVLLGHCGFFANQGLKPENDCHISEECASVAILCFRVIQPG
jgi:hypothetical protein